jgi:hypothetical protein
MRRCLYAAGLALSTALLGACGGVDPAEGVLQAAADSCVIAEGASSCRISVSWSTANTAGPVITAGGATLAAGFGGVAELPVVLTGTTYRLQDQGSTLAQLALRARCAANTEGDSQGVCQPTVLRYTEKIYALFEDGYPRAVSRTQATRLSNLTRHGTLANCRFKPRAQANGRIEIYCDAPDGTGFPPVFKAYINPLTESIHDSDLTPPVTADYGLDDPWESIPESPIVRIVERVSDGVFYVSLVQQELGRLSFLKTGATSSQPVVDDREINFGACLSRCGGFYFLRMVRSYSN